MTQLAREGTELVRAVRAALLPTDVDRKRVYRALVLELGGMLATVGAAGGAQASIATKAGFFKVLGTVTGLGLAGSGLFLTTRTVPPPTASDVSAPAETPRVPARSREVPVETAVPSAPTQPVVATASKPAERAPATRRSSDSLAREVAILSRAGASLHAGRPAEVLAILEEHERNFPGGVLAQERAGARIRALCALGRTAEARTHLERLAQASPNSVHEARARRACGFTATGEHR